MRVAVANGVDVVALETKVRAIIEDRIAAAERSERTSFSIGETVALRSDSKRVGVITSITPSNRAIRYGVFIDGRMETLYGSQLLPADIAPAAIGATINELNARLTALQLAAPSLANLYSPQAGRIDFIPYQFRPVLKPFGPTVRGFSSLTKSVSARPSRQDCCYASCKRAGHSVPSSLSAPRRWSSRRSGIARCDASTRNS